METGERLHKEFIIYWLEREREREKEEERGATMMPHEFECMEISE